MFQYIPSGDSAFIIKTGNDISAGTNSYIRKLLIRIDNEKIEGVLDLIPSYNELMICYDQGVVDYKKLLGKLRALENDIDEIAIAEPSEILVPVVYGGEYGPDLEFVAEVNGLSAEDVIRIHSEAQYTVYMLGFTPGFCYLGGLDKRIITPRRKTPRLSVPAGSVGIADKQSGIYSIISPGGWQILGRTPLRLFDQNVKPEFLFQPGDNIKFYAVTEDEFQEIERSVTKKNYKVKRGKQNL